MIGERAVTISVPGGSFTAKSFIETGSKKSIANGLTKIEFALTGGKRRLLETERLAENQETILHGKHYRILRLLGHGKGGYSYLAEYEGRLVVLKQIHHEPCDYYSFGNKIETEQRDYTRLRNAGIRIPEMLDIDVDTEQIIKEYIDGPTVAELIKDGVSAKAYLPQVREIAAKAMAAGLNIDYYPTNFVVSDNLLWYVDYECNDYMEHWDFEHWGIQHWVLKEES